MEDLRIITDYKTRVASRYIALTKEQIAYKLIESDLYFISKKIDGHFVALHVQDGKATLFNRTGKKIIVPQILNEAETIFNKQNIILACELYVHDGTQRTRSFHVSEAITSPDNFDLRLAVYDLISIDNEPARLSPVQLSEQLRTLIANGKKIHAIEQHIVKSKDEVNRYYEEQVERNQAEGVVIRSGEGMTYKVKPRHSMDAVIIGYSEGQVDREGLLRNVLTAFMKPDGSLHVSAKVGSGFTEEQRTTLLNQLKTMHVASEYVEVADSYVAFQMVRPEIIIEFSCLDVVPEINGKVITKMELEYSEAGGYVPIAPANSATIISPVFEGVRKDKQFNAVDIRFKQLADVGQIDSMPSTHNLPKSTLIKKEIYVKEAKGEKAIRKFQAWKTNKEQSRLFPPYVFYFTDYSAGRKDMLQQEMKIASTEEEVTNIFDEAIVENVKKGWNRISI